MRSRVREYYTGVPAIHTAFGGVLCFIGPSYAGVWVVEMLKQAGYNWQMVLIHEK